MASDPESSEVNNNMADREALPAQASLMGLATETRLKIYENLLTPHLTEAQREQHLEGGHSCLCDQGDHWPRCSCTGMNVFPQILAVSKQVFEEAMPVLYENFELRLRVASQTGLPWPRPFDAIPGYARRHVRKTLLVGIFVFDSPPSEVLWIRRASATYFEEYISTLSETLTGIRTLRLFISHAQPFGSILPAVPPRCDLTAILRKLQRLQSIPVAVVVRFPWQPHDLSLASVTSEKLVRWLQDGAKSLGRDVAVSGMAGMDETN